MIQPKQAVEDARKGGTWRDIPITGRESLRRALIKKHGSLTNAAESMKVDFQVLSDSIGGRRQIFGVISAIQADLDLSNEQVLVLWPLLREWPRKSKMVS